MNARRYRIAVEGSIGESWSPYFAGLTVTAEPTGVTRLCGEIADQSALHGLLNKIRDLNLRLVSVQLLDSDGVTPVECRHCRMANPTDGQNKPRNTPFGR
ncbi:MAG: hypothetical protein M0Z94_14865 [Dehalococcoidales bacterium]|nr:hypothetical protein [Dehalococcoidales bacterium]